MRRSLFGARRALAGALVLVTTAGCADGDRRAGAPSPTTSSPAARSVELEPEPVTGGDSAPIALTPAEREQLGIPPVSGPSDPSVLAPLTATQWGDPAAVAARLALLQTTYRADEDLAVVEQRWRPYLAARYAEDLAARAGDGGDQSELPAGAKFVGEVLGAGVERSGDRAEISLTVRRSVVVGGRELDRARVLAWQVTLVFDRASARWLVVAIDRS